MDFIDKVKKTIQKYNMLSRGDKILAAVSGGPDSLALLYILKYLRAEYSLEVYVVSINHMFRGEQGRKEVEWVAELSHRWGMTCFTYHQNIPEIISKQGLSPEEAGHIVRKKIYNNLRVKYKFDKLALGHHAEDRAETILMHLVQGTGLKGLASMPPKFNWVIRPLAEVTKKEILDFCQEENLPYFLDPTNKEDIYLRNKIRLKLLPLLKEELNPNIIAALLRLEDIVLEDNDFLEKYTDSQAQGMLIKEEDDTITIDLQKFNKKHLAIRRRIVRNIFQRIKPSSQGLSFVHVENIIKIAQNKKGRQEFSLPERITVEKTYDRLIFRSRKKTIKKPSDTNEEFLWHIPGNLTLALESGELKGYYTLERPAIKSRDFFIVILDADKVANPLLVRKRQPGDRIQPLGMEGTKKLKNFFIDKKVEREKRDKIPLICSGGEIIWIPGLTMSEKVKPNKGTKKYLVLEFLREQDV